MNTKALSQVQIKSESEGTVSAVFSTLGVVDKDGDVTVKGAFTDGAAVVISAYGHRSHDGALPVGKGTIREDGDKVVMDGEFFMNTTHGRDAFETVKELGELQEWSYSLNDVKADRNVVFDGAKVRRVIKSVRVKEVSPVLMGAGIDTGTLEAKSFKQLDSGVRRGLADAGRERWGNEQTYVYPADYDVDAGFVIYSIYPDGDAERLIQVQFSSTDDGVTLGDEETEVEQVTDYAPKSATKFSTKADNALRGVAPLVAEACERLPLRTAEGKSIDEQVQFRDALAAHVENLTKAIDGTTQETKSADDSATKEWLRFVAHQNGIPA